MLSRIGCFKRSTSYIIRQSSNPRSFLGEQRIQRMRMVSLLGFGIVRWMALADRFIHSFIHSGICRQSFIRRLLLKSKWCSTLCRIIPTTNGFTRRGRYSCTISFIPALLWRYTANASFLYATTTLVFLILLPKLPVAEIVVRNDPLSLSFSRLSQSPNRPNDETTKWQTQQRSNQSCRVFENIK